VAVYVEGSSDIQAMTQLLGPLILTKSQQGIEIKFLAERKGDAKKHVLLHVPQRAAIVLTNDPNRIVVAMPDLYPKNKGFAHKTKDELISGIINNFEKALPKKVLDDERIKKRFKVFCFKYDLEALILAAEDSLKAHLGISKFKLKWTKPVEDQDFNEPPKRIVEDLFASYGKVYKGPVDAPSILATADYQDIVAKCPQCFKPFVDFLEKLPDIS
jgi:hypothetical protein